MVSSELFNSTIARAARGSHGLPSFYRDVKFRSLIEARWAALFDHYKLKWVYEPDGFDTPHGRYCPDFLLPTLKTYVEVKSEPGAIREGAIRFISKASGYQFLVLDAPMVECRSYPLMTPGHAEGPWPDHEYWDDMAWCASEEYLHSERRFYVSTGMQGSSESRPCPFCDGDEARHFRRIRSMRFENGRAVE